MNKNAVSIYDKHRAIRHLNIAITYTDIRYKGWNLEYYPDYGRFKEETVIITCENGHQYSVCVEADSIVAMIADVCKELLRH